MRRLSILWVLPLLWLAGCASLHEQPAPENQKIPWGNRVQALSTIQTWDLDALIAIRGQAAHDTGSASMKWQQSKQNYHILLFGPMGSNAVTLSGRPGRVFLETANGQKFNASSPEYLLAKQTGLNVPVSYLFYWIRGIPVPNLPADTRFDAYNHLVQLNQAGWNIQFLRYVSVNQLDVPNKIFLNNPLYQVKIIVNQWQF